MSNSKRYEVILTVNGEHYDVIAEHNDKQKASVFANKHNKAQDWFDAYTDYEFTHTDDTWEVIVKELNG